MQYIIQWEAEILFSLTWDRVKWQPSMKGGGSSRDSSRSAGIEENTCGVIEGSLIPSDCCFTKLIKTW